MADPQQPTPNIAGNGFIWIVLVAAGTFFVAHQVPLEGGRPPTMDRFIFEQAGVQDIDARLWQDPFAAVAQTLARSPDLKAENCAPEIADSKIKDQVKDHCRAPNEPETETLVLVASVTGAPYSEDHELRRRTRYAVLAGLNAEGFVPRDPEHIGFYWPQAPTVQPGAPRTVRLPKVVPFEEFTPKSNRESLPYGQVLLLWFNEDVLGNTPLKQFSGFLCELPAAVRSKVKILGPQSSTALQAMVREANQSKDRSSSDCPALQFYVYSATTDDATLIPSYLSSCLNRDTCLGEFFRHRGIELHRMIATDEALARTITQELRLRRVDRVGQKVPSHIALVSEWDTVYGRALPESMARCLREPPECRQDGRPPPAKPWLHPFKYLRGLDGQMPGVDGSRSGSGGSSDKDDKPDGDAKDGTKTPSDPKMRDRAEGQGQFDYLRRLGDSMQQLDAELRQENPNGIEAIGVLGSDMYDKMLVLQALRPLFRNAVFFTTDLDASLLHPIAQIPTRNLLVASGFGLQLRPDIQGEIPPFRSSYQTAGFLATRIAIRSKEGPPPTWKMQPTLFEIGARRAFQFPSQGSGKPATTEAKRPDHEPCATNLLKCTELHPLASSMFPPLNAGFAVAVAVLGLGLALSFPTLRRRIWNGVDAFMRGADGYAAMTARFAVVLIGLCVVILGLAVAIDALWPQLAAWLTEDGQPMTSLEGISVWPTIFLRLAALVLCIGLIAFGWKQLDENMEKIAEDLHLAKTREDVKAKQDDLVRNSPPWIGFASQFWYRLPGDDDADNGDHPNNVRRFWRVYIYQGRWTGRLIRVAAVVMFMIVFWWMPTSVFETPHPPARGDVSFRAYQTVTILLFFATLFLIFFVADTTLLCWRMVKALRAETTVWPSRTLKEVSGRLVLPKSDLDDWIDLIFVSKRTKCINTLIYYPFVILALLVASRSPLFANYAPSIPDLIATGLGVLVVIGCAVALHWSAEASRAQARRRLNERIVAARKSEDKGRAGQLEMLLRRVEELRDGAFSPFSQQPLVRAMLLPLGSLGGTALLGYFLMPGIS